MVLCTLFRDFPFPILVIISFIFPIQVFLLYYCSHCVQRCNSLIFNRLQRNNHCVSLCPIVSHCFRFKCLIIKGLYTFPRKETQWEQWFDQLFGGGLSRFLPKTQWNNSFTNFFRGSSSLRTHIPYHCLLLVPATGANILGLGGTQKTRAPLSPGRSSFLKFPAKANLIPRSGQLEVPHIG